MSEDSNVVHSTMLIVLGDELIPERVTELLGIDPTRSWRRGEPKSYTLPDGKLLQFDGVHEWGGWKCSIPADMRGEELGEQLAVWCDVLQGREPALRELEAQGCYLHIDCYVAADESAVVEVSADLQRRLSNLRLNLTLTFHADSPKPAPEAEPPDAAGRE